MNQVFSTFSFGNALDILAGVLGWSPQGRLISLASVEGPSRDQLEGRAFVVREVLDGNLVVASQEGGARGDYVLRPRHRGWTARSLIGTSIAVTVHPLTVDGEGDAIGIAMVRLRRQS